jgi:hypothetical protein
MIKLLLKVSGYIVRHVWLIAIATVIVYASLKAASWLDKERDHIAKIQAATDALQRLPPIDGALLDGEKKLKSQIDRQQEVASQVTSEIQRQGRTAIDRRLVSNRRSIEDNEKRAAALRS